jgi:hypothetical protein
VSLGRKRHILPVRPLHVEFLRPFGAETLRLPQAAATLCGLAARGGMVRGTDEIFGSD